MPQVSSRRVSTADILSSAGRDSQYRRSSWDGFRSGLDQRQTRSTGACSHTALRTPITRRAAPGTEGRGNQNVLCSQPPLTPAQPPPSSPATAAPVAVVRATADEAEGAQLRVAGLTVLERALRQLLRMRQ